ncbi:MAG: hypothetical protein ACXWGW_09035 [Methylobacter sp.]
MSGLLRLLVRTASPEKVSALKTATYFRERQARGEIDAFDTWLNASPESEPMKGDELD